jgi:hypothetical protein
MAKDVWFLLTFFLANVAEILNEGIEHDLIFKENHNGYYNYSLYVYIENMNFPKYFVHFEYMLKTMYGLKT